MPANFSSRGPTFSSIVPFFRSLDIAGRKAFQIVDGLRDPSLQFRKARFRVVVGRRLLAGQAGRARAWRGRWRSAPVGSASACPAQAVACRKTCGSILRSAALASRLGKHVAKRPAAAPKTPERKYHTSIASRKFSLRAVCVHWLQIVMATAPAQGHARAAIDARLARRGFEEAIMSKAIFLAVPAALFASVLATASAGAAEPAYLDDRSDAASLVQSLYNAINRHEYARAWDYFGDDEAGQRFRGLRPGL